MKELYILFICLFFLEGVFAQTALQYKLEKDDEFVVKQQAEQIITQELVGTSHVLTNNIDGILQFKVLDEVENGYNIELTFQDLNMTISSSIQGEVMNIKAKEVTEGDIQSMMFNSLLGSPVKITLSKTGKILEVFGGDSLVTKMVAVAGLEDEFTANMMKKSLEKEYGSEALSNSYEQMTFIYPENSVTVGETWQNEYSGKLTAKNTWTLSDLADSHAEIKGKAVIVMKIEEPATTMNLSGNQTTSVTTDLDTGFIQKMEVLGSAEGVSTVSQMGDQEIPTKIESTITYELITE